MPLASLFTALLMLPTLAGPISPFGYTIQVVDVHFCASTILCPTEVTLPAHTLVHILAEVPEDPAGGQDPFNPPTPTVWWYEIQVGSRVGYLPASTVRLVLLKSSLAYTGPATVHKNSTFTPSAQLVCPATALSGRNVTFTLSRTPSTGRGRPYRLGSALTSVHGRAAITISTYHWRPGSYRLTITYAGSSTCAPARASVLIHVN